MHAVHEIGAPGNHHDASEANAWICPMHPQIHQDHPGRCPICGMDLVPASHEPATAEASDHGAISEHEHHRSEEHTSELQSLMRISYAVFCLKKKKKKETKQRYNKTNNKQ